MPETVKAKAHIRVFMKKNIFALFCMLIAIFMVFYCYILRNQSHSHDDLNQLLLIKGKEMISNGNLWLADSILRLLISCNDDHWEINCREARHILLDEPFISFYTTNDISSYGGYWTYSSKERLFDQESVRRMFGRPHKISHDYIKGCIQWVYINPSNTISILFLNNKLVAMEIKTEKGYEGIDSW